MIPSAGWTLKLHFGGSGAQLRSSSYSVRIVCFRFDDLLNQNTGAIVPSQLADNKLWWSGPEFLQSDQTQWPRLEKVRVPEGSSSEIRNKKAEYCKQKVSFPQMQPL